MTKLRFESKEIKGNLFLTQANIIDKTSTIKTRLATNHVFCCDISGSMWGSLELMKKHLKNRIPDIVNKDDTVTLIAFSGHNECVTIKEHVHVNNISELKAMNDAIDRYMKAWGCTCFYDPVKTTVDLISKYKGGLYNFIFLSDGGNNDCPWEDVINVLNELSDKVGSSTIIEYGYYADTEKLNEMSETLGGSKINAAEFESYTPVIEKALQGGTEHKRLIDIGDIKGDMKYTQVVYFNNDQINVVSCAGSDQVALPESVETFYCLTTENEGESKKDFTNALYAMAYVCAGALRYPVVEAILSKLGDSKFIEIYCNAFGKQKLFDFQNQLSAATFDKKQRGKFVANYKPNPKAYCVLDFLTDLKDGGAQIRVVPLFESYNRTTAKTVAKAVLSSDDKKKIAEAKTANDLKKLAETVKGQEVEMTMIDKGYSMENFVWNEDRANMSALLAIDVELKLPTNKFKLDTIDSFVYRNVTIIKDGILNVKKLPLIISDDLYKKLSKKTKLTIEVDQDTCPCCKDKWVTIDISELPIVNRNYTHSVSSKEMTELALEIMHKKFELKYLGYLKKNSDKPVPPKPITKDEKARAWLAELGITEKGYSPKTEREKTGEFYMALTFKSEFAKFSSIPKIDDVKKKLQSKKSLTPSEQLMNKIMEETDKVLKTKKLEDLFDERTKEKLAAVESISKMKFGLILSRKWFSDRKGFEDNHAEITDIFGFSYEINYNFTETKQNL